MQPIIDITTGELKFVTVNKKENFLETLTKELSTFKVPKELDKIDTDINALFNP